MADYTDWDINDYLPGQPLTSAKAISYHENLDATAEGAPGSPIVHAGFHPYDMTAAGGSETGLIYDHAVGGDVAAIESPVFLQGYEYRLFWDELAKASVGSETFNISLRRKTGATYQLVSQIAIAARNGGYVDTILPPVGMGYGLISGVAQGIGQTGGAATGVTGGPDRVKLEYSDNADFTGGKAWLYKRYTGTPKN